MAASDLLLAHAQGLQKIISDTDGQPTIAILITQRSALQKQIAVLNKQIHDAEGPDVQVARLQLQNMLRTGMIQVDANGRITIPGPIAAPKK